MDEEQGKKVMDAEKNRLMGLFTLTILGGIILLVIGYFGYSILNPTYQQGYNHGYSIGLDQGYTDGSVNCLGGIGDTYNKTLLLNRQLGFSEGYANKSKELEAYAWYLVFGDNQSNDTIYIKYANDIVTDPFAVPRDYVHTRCINGTWYCSKRMCIVAKANGNLLEPNVKYLCTEQYFIDLAAEFKSQNMTDVAIKNSVDDMRLQCVVEEQRRLDALNQTTTTTFKQGGE